MDTDSIPFYMKNIGVIYNEYSEFKKAYIWLENAVRINFNNDLYDQLIISLTGMKCFDRIISSIKVPETFIQVTSLAFAHKNKGEYIKSLEYYKKAYEQKKENWIIEDINWIENEINKKN
jgi:tetratricopeptide (TPR) repeat protein